MSGREERGLDDEDRNRRRWIRRREDAELHDGVGQLGESVMATARVVARHAVLFQEMGVEDLSKEQREALPVVLSHAVTTNHTQKRWAWGLPLLVAVAGVISPHLDGLFNAIAHAVSK